MGHIRLKRLPATRKWQQVVALLADGSAVEEIAGASADAANHALEHARDDETLAHCFWLLTQLPLAAREVHFRAAAHSLGLSLPPGPSFLEILAAFGEAVDRETGFLGRTDLGEMAQSAAIESLSAVAGADLPGLFEPSAGDARLEFARLAAPDHFAGLAREFFARLTRRHLNYYLSRAVSDVVGPGHRLASTADHSAFNAALEQHCWEASRIVEAFAGGWYSKTNYEGGIDRDKARGFVFVALGKILTELRVRGRGG